MKSRLLIFGILAIFVSAFAQTTTTIPGDLRVKKHARIDSLANDSTMMVVADTLGRLSVLPIPGGGSGGTPANPAASIGLSVVNGSASTYMRSDAAPPLSQAIRPTWTDKHVHSDTVSFGSVVQTPLTATRLMTVNAASEWAVNAALTNQGMLYATGAGGIASTSAAGNGQILIGSTGNAPALGTITGTANQISVAQGAGTLGLSLPNTVILPDSLNVASLTGADTRMVVAGADGGIFTQSIPSGVSPANPSASVGLSAVNGAANTYMRSDGAPALSQAIRPMWSDQHAFMDTVLFRRYLLGVTDTGAPGGAWAYVRSNTSDGADSGLLILTGAGGTSGFGETNRGASIALGGNEGTLAGGIRMDVGTSGLIDFRSTAGGARFGYTSGGNPWGVWTGGDTYVGDSLRVEGNSTFAGDAIIGDSARVVGTLRHSATVKDIDTLSSASSTIPVPRFGADLYTVTLTQDVTITVQSGAEPTGRHFTLRVHQDGTGGRDITWNAVFEFPEGVEPTQNTSPDGWSYYSFLYNEIEGTWDYIGGALGFGGGS